MKLTNHVAGAWLRDLRKAAGLQQQDVADAIGATGPWLCAMERKAQVTPPDAQSIHDAIINLHTERERQFSAARKHPDKP